MEKSSILSSLNRLSASKYCATEGGNKIEFQHILSATVGAFMSYVDTYGEVVKDGTGEGKEEGEGEGREGKGKEMGRGRRWEGDRVKEGGWEAAMYLIVLSSHMFEALEFILNLFN